MTNETKYFLKIDHKSYILQENYQNTVGRNREAQVNIKNATVGRFHAVIAIIGSCAYVSHFKSTNNTLLNDEKLLPYKLYEIKDGDILQFGEVVAIFNASTDLDPNIENNDSQTFSESFFENNTQFLEATDFHEAATQRIIKEESNKSANENTYSFHEAETQVILELDSAENDSLVFFHEAETQVVDKSEQDNAINETIAECSDASSDASFDFLTHDVKERLGLNEPTPVALVCPNREIASENSVQVENNVTVENDYSICSDTCSEPDLQRSNDDDDEIIPATQASFIDDDVIPETPIKEQRSKCVQEVTVIENVKQDENDEFYIKSTQQLDESANITENLNKSEENDDIYVQATQPLANVEVTSAESLQKSNEEIEKTSEEIANEKTANTPTEKDEYLLQPTQALTILHDTPGKNQARCVEDEFVLKFSAAQNDELSSTQLVTILNESLSPAKTNEKRDDWEEIQSTQDVASALLGTPSRKVGKDEFILPKVFNFLRRPNKKEDMPLTQALEQLHDDGARCAENAVVEETGDFVVPATQELVDILNEKDEQSGKDDVQPTQALEKLHESDEKNDCQVSTAENVEMSSDQLVSILTDGVDNDGKETFIAPFPPVQKHKDETNEKVAKEDKMEVDVPLTQALEKLHGDNETSKAEDVVDGDFVVPATQQLVEILNEEDSDTLQNEKLHDANSECSTSKNVEDELVLNELVSIFGDESASCPPAETTKLSTRAGRKRKVETDSIPKEAAKSSKSKENVEGKRTLRGKQPKTETSKPEDNLEKIVPKKLRSATVKKDENSKSQELNKSEAVTETIKLEDNVEKIISKKLRSATVKKDENLKSQSQELDKPELVTEKIKPDDNTEKIVPKKLRSAAIKKDETLKSQSQELKPEAVIKSRKRTKKSEAEEDVKEETDVVAKKTRKKSEKVPIEANESVISTPNRSRRTTKPKVVFTLINDPTLESAVRQLGGQIVDDIDQATVLVTGSVKRTEKLLAAIGQGKPICSPEWLIESKKRGVFLDCDNFIVRDKEAERKWNFSLKESIERGKNAKLLADHTFQVMANPALACIKKAIEACGGTCATRNLSKSKTSHLFIVGSNENKQAYSKVIKENRNVKVVLPEAIFDGCLRQQFKFEDFLIA